MKILRAYKTRLSPNQAQQPVLTRRQRSKIRSGKIQAILDRLQFMD